MNTDYETLKAERDAALNTCSLIAQTSTNKDCKTVYRYAETNLIFTIAEDEKLVHCFDIDEPQTDLLKFVPSMSAVLESFGVSVKDFKKDFGGRGLSLSDYHNMHDIEIDSLTAAEECADE
ncbi:hypothetical protein [Yersinia kristensenii]|uniref:Uncharacterized protein n=1 Tax=Yersinia kristensenii TaxID=28152 RepID=A0AB73NLM2_YERKR|nr:hypothetical protein [Yersinia kristensenii]OVZ82203.1 hypothetical protein CBW52_05180 [Yersinia kristensenii]